MTFEKFVTSSVQKVKILGVQKSVIQGADYKSVCLPNVLSFCTNNLTNLPKVTKLMTSPNCHFRLVFFVTENLKFEW